MISTQRSPNLPAEQTKTSSPGEKKFWVAASVLRIRTTPEPARRCSSANGFQIREHLLVQLAEVFGPMMMSEPIMACKAAGSSGVGPGVRSRCFFIYIDGGANRKGWKP